MIFQKNLILSISLWGLLKFLMEVIFCEPTNDTPINLGMVKFKIDLTKVDEIIQDIKSNIWNTRVYGTNKKDSIYLNWADLKHFMIELKKTNFL